MKSVKLLNIGAKSEQDFRLDHAENLLVYEAAKGLKLWTLPDNSPYTFTDGKLILSSSDKADKGTGKSEGITKGNSKKTQA